MRLYGSPTSPFVRKVRVVLELAEKPYEFTVLNPHERPAELMAHNPLSRVPTLVLDNGDSIIDSSLIIRYLLDTHSHLNLISQGDNKWQDLNKVALIDGAMDYCIVMMLEGMRKTSDANKYDQSWLSIHRTLEWFDQVFELPEPLSLVEISLITLLEYIDLRSEPLREADFGLWRSKYPNLAQWLLKVKDHAIYKKTNPNV